MDTLDKLIIEKTQKEYKKIFKEEICINRILDGEIIFCFNEFEHIKIINESNKVIIECEQPNSEDYVQINPGAEIVINDYEYGRLESKNNIFFPEKYIIRLIKENITSICFFDVKSNALGSKIDNIRRIINDFSQGLELDLINSIRGKNYIDSKKNIFTPLFEKIINNERMLQFELNFIIDYPIKDIIKTIKYSKKEGKTSREKIKYDIKKSITTNDYRKRVIQNKQLSLNNYSNIVLKNAVLRIIKVCNELDKYFLNNINYLEQNLFKKRINLKKAQDKQEKLSTKKHGKKYINNVSSEYYDLLNTIEANQEDKELFLERRKVINRVRNNFINIINESWINKIKDDYIAIDSSSARKNIHYKKIIDFANEINTQYDSKYSSEGIYSYKKTSELYELYVLILMFKILIKENYSFSIDNIYDFNLVFDNEEFVFNKNKKSIRILYDKVVKRTDDFPEDELANQNSNSNKPDIVLMIYDDGTLTNCVIIEVKCRKKRNIYSKNGDTEVITQLKDYTNFWYFTKERILKKDVIDKVYAIYPDDTPSKEFYNANQICFLSLEPVYEYESSLGFINLYDELKLYI